MLWNIKVCFIYRDLESFEVGPKSTEVWCPPIEDGGYFMRWLLRLTRCICGKWNALSLWPTPTCQSLLSNCLHAVNSSCQHFKHKDWEIHWLWLILEFGCTVKALIQNFIKIWNPLFSPPSLETLGTAPFTLVCDHPRCPLLCVIVFINPCCQQTSPWWDMKDWLIESCSAKQRWEAKHVNRPATGLFQIPSASQY